MMCFGPIKWRPNSKFGPMAQFEECGSRGSRGAVVEFPQLVWFPSGDFGWVTGVRVVILKAGSAGCQLRSPADGDYLSAYVLLWPLQEFENLIAWRVMAIPDEEDELLAQFLESEVLSEVSDKVCIFFLSQFYRFCFGVGRVGI